MKNCIDKYQFNKSYKEIKLPYTVVEDNSLGRLVYVGYFEAPEEITGLINQADSLEELDKNMMDSFKFLLKYYEEESRILNKRAIFRSNRSGGHFWFRIIGIGATVNWTDGKYIKIKRGWKWFGITSVEGLRIGKLLIFFQNEWKH